ncbi:MAG: 30S ribosomal protein S4, partial [Candidatus Micrarchaeota archaeon]
MGNPKKLRKNYETPSHPWEKKRLTEENELVTVYGLKNKSELWKAKAKISKYRKLAREIVGLEADK